MYTQMWGGYGKWRCVTNSVKKVCKSKRRVDEVDITKAWKNKISLPNPDNLIYITETERFTLFSSWVSVKCNSRMNISSSSVNPADFWRNHTIA